MRARRPARRPPRPGPRRRHRHDRGPRPQPSTGTSSGSRCPPTWPATSCDKGSITVDGVSLTVVDGRRPVVHRQPHPDDPRATTLGRKQAGDPVNLEVDVIAKYVERLLGAARPGRHPPPEDPAMSACTGLNDARAFTAGRPARHLAEILGNVFGLALAVGGMRRKVWAWPVGIVGNVLLFTVFCSPRPGRPAPARCGPGRPAGVLRRRVGLRLVALVDEQGAAAPARRPSRPAGPPAGSGWPTSRLAASRSAPATTRSGPSAPASRRSGGSTWPTRGSSSARSSRRTRWPAAGWTSGSAGSRSTWSACRCCCTRTSTPRPCCTAVYGVLFVVWGFVTWLKIAQHRGGRGSATPPGGRTRCGHERRAVSGWTRSSGRSPTSRPARPWSSWTTRTARTRETSSSPRRRPRPHCWPSRSATPRAWCACRWRVATWTGSSCRR